ncbi:haloalkane dehalogenase [Friedmanniella luteola]|uniref:Haloalkane dehalogenase n=1 Tax=Friedmanniella luteola TaxID=546871 RepID=A0A1H1RRC1_9ACTN|nr:haloalkane dehalogenase [Friedmanniella luteola]SDS38182.1 haloalkane dehalogenase [Friedmanniella luteola]
MPDVALLEVPVRGSTMAYREAGAGRPVLLLHGNPTSSFLWRHVLRRAAAGEPGAGRWIAPDLIGMGSSGKPDLAYTFADHALFVDGFIEALGLTDLVLVGHDWGVALAVDRARRHPVVRGLALMEGHLRPLPGWEAFDEGGRQLFQQLRAPGTGERMVLQENFFLDTLLLAALLRPLGPDELAVYRAPYPDPAARRPLLQWARAIPVAGEPDDVTRRLTAGAQHLATTSVPTLLLHGDPGVLVTADTVTWWRRHVPALTVADVGGPAGHFLPEDRPEAVADALLAWVQDLA